MKRLLIGLLFLTALAFGQVSAPTTFFAGTPPGGIGGSCTATTYGYLNSSGQIITCQSNVWTVSVGGGSVSNSGTLTSNYLVVGNGSASVKVFGSAYFDGSNNLILPAGLSTGGAASGNSAMSGSSSGTVTVTVAAAGTWTLTLPTTGGTTGYMLFDSDGAGTATWSNNGSALVPAVTLSAATPATVAGSGYWLNNTASPWTANLPTVTSATVGAQYCVGNAAARASAVTIQLPASTYMYYKGVIGGAAGTLVSGGAAGDIVCVVAIDTTHYQALGTGNGTWTNN